MRQAPGEAVQKLCPRCSTLAYTGDRRCPWCGGSYSRRGVPPIAALLLLQTALLVAGIVYVGVVVGDQVNTRIDREVGRVQTDLAASFDDVRRQVRRELDRRLPPVP